MEFRGIRRVNKPQSGLFSSHYNMKHHFVFKEMTEMLPEKSLAWGQSKSCIRELAAYGTARKAEIGKG